jgi:hypothetical protein
MVRDFKTRGSVGKGTKISGQERCNHKQLERNNRRALCTYTKDSVIDWCIGSAHSEITRGSERNQLMSENRWMCPHEGKRKELKLDLAQTGGGWRKRSYLIGIDLVLLLVTVPCLAGVSEQLKEAEGLVQSKQYDTAEKVYKAVLSESTDKDQQLAAQKGLALLYITAN